MLYVNPRYVSVVGASSAELIENPRSALAHVHFDDAPRIAKLLPKLIASMRRARKMEFNVRIDHPLRGVRMLNVRLSPVRLRDGTVRVFGIADDVTERSAAERQRLEEAVKQRDILVREVHHRIKNNLQGVAGLLQQIAQRKPEVAPAIHEVVGQVQAIAQVYGLQVGVTGPLRMKSVLEAITGSVRRTFGRTIRCRIDGPRAADWILPEGEAIPVALTLNELLTNAIKHSPDGDAGEDEGIDCALEGEDGGVRIAVRNRAQLPAGFSLGRIPNGISGLGLVRALLPRRGASLSIEQAGRHVVATVDLSAPVVARGGAE